MKLPEVSRIFRSFAWFLVVPGVFAVPIWLLLVSGDS